MRRLAYLVVVGFLLAVTLAEGAVVVARVTGSFDANPICALYKPDDMTLTIATTVLLVLAVAAAVALSLALACDPNGELWRKMPAFCSYPIRRVFMIPLGVVAFTVIGAAQLSVVGEGMAAAASIQAEAPPRGPVTVPSTQGGPQGDGNMTEEMVTRIVTQGGAVAVLLVVLWSYRRDFFRKLEDKDRELQERREEKDTLLDLLAKSTTAITSSAIATANQTSATSRLARTVEGIERKLDEARAIRIREDRS